MLDIPGMAYFKKNTWCGSHKQQRCRIAVVEDNFVVSIWNEPFGYEATPKENIVNTSFERSEVGLEQVNAYLKERML